MPDISMAGGVSCLQVLEGLSDFLDDELPAEVRQAVNQHLAECRWCERFGGNFGAAMREVRTAISQPEAIDPEVSRRLAQQLGLADK